jgi:Flavin containing amine oxidoreductase
VISFYLYKCNNKLTYFHIIFCMFLLNYLFVYYFVYSGLTAAYKLKSKGINVILFESQGNAGGKMRNNSENSFLWDEGANTMVHLLLP